jgi:hypothetical protein
MTFHQSAKSELKETAKYMRITYKTDKPAQRQVINDKADELSRKYWRHYSEKQAANLSNHLHSFAASLHP